MNLGPWTRLGLERGGAEADEYSMDMSSVASDIASQRTMNAIDTAVARKALDVAKDQGQAMVSLIKECAACAPGTPAVDASGRVDTYA